MYHVLHFAIWCMARHIITYMLGFFHGCILHVKACTNVYCIAFTYHLLVFFPYDFSPSGCMHYVTCIGNRYMLQNLYRTHIISLMIIWLHVMYISQHILYQSIWLCALCNLYWETGTCCKLIPNTYYITYDYMIACNVHIATHIISAHLAVCIM